VLLTVGDVPLRTASFTLEDRWLLWARACLYADRLELTGWYLWGRYERRIPLRVIERVEAPNGCLVLHLQEGRTVTFAIDRAARWKTSIEIYREVLQHVE
jgi:hypothetical protein